MVAGTSMVRLEIFYIGGSILCIKRDFSANAVISRTCMCVPPHISQLVPEVHT